MAIVDELVTVLKTVLGDGTEEAIDNYKKGVDSAIGAAKEAAQQAGVSGNAAQKQGAAMKSAGKSASSAGMGFLALADYVKSAAKQFTLAAGAVTTFIGIAINSAASLQTVSETTGVSTDKLQEWAYAANSVGVSASAVQGDLAKMQKQAQWTGRSLESWADSFKGMSIPTANMWGEALGISPDTVRLLREGRDGIAALKKEAHDVGAVISPEDIKRAAQLKTSVMTLTTQMRAFGTSLAIGTIPMIEKLTKSFREWIGTNKEWITTNISRFLENLGRVFNELWNDGKKLIDWFSDALGPVGDFGKKIWEATDWAKLLKGAVVLLAAAFAPAIATITGVSVAIIAVSAAIEDFIGFMEGKDSLIGRFVDAFTERFPNLAALLKDVVVGAFNLGKQAISGLWELLKTIASGIGGVIGAIVGGLDKAIGKMREFFGLKDLNKDEDTKDESSSEVVDKSNRRPYNGGHVPSEYSWNEQAQYPQAKDSSVKLFNEREQPSYWQGRSYAPLNKTPVSAELNSSSSKEQLSAAGKELARNATAMRYATPQASGKDPFIFPRQEQRPGNVTNKNQANQTTLNSNVKIEVADPSQVGPTLESLQRTYPDAQINNPGTYGPSVG